MALEVLQHAGRYQESIQPQGQGPYTSWLKEDPTQTFYLRVCFLGLFLVLILLDPIPWKKDSTEICI